MRPTSIHPRPYTSRVNFSLPFSATHKRCRCNFVEAADFDGPRRDELGNFADDTRNDDAPIKLCCGERFAFIGFCAEQC